MIGMLSAIPKTPLYQRLSDNGRLGPEESEFGTNVIPLGMSREELREGFVQLMRDLYEPNAYFERFESLYLTGGFTCGRPRSRYWQRHPWARLKARAVEIARCAVLCWRLSRRISQPQLRREYRRRLWRLLRTRADPSILFIFLLKCAAHYHHYLMAEQMAQGKTPPLNPF
jgi:hypothetical protein